MIHIIDLHFKHLAQTIASFLIETSDGPVLVETGPHSTFANLKKGVEKAGFTIDDVRHVFLTHIHLDHAGAAWDLAGRGATIYLHPFGQRHMADPSKLMESARRIYQDQMDSLWGDMRAIDEARLHPTEHGETITVGNRTFRALHTPGHAVHHIAWQMGGTIFTGDVAGVKIASGPVVPPCPPPDINLEDWKQSLALLRGENPAKLYLTHFGIVENYDPHFDYLEREMDAWANWMKPHFDAGETPDEITPAFVDFVEERLTGGGMAKADLPLYEAANPSWMSVAGLLRYWKKKTA